ncbi:MAG: hypothetical protein WBF06_16060 [Candidatus Acidiferrales bacterium]
MNRLATPPIQIINLPFPRNCTVAKALPTPLTTFRENEELFCGFKRCTCLRQRPAASSPREYPLEIVFAALKLDVIVHQPSGLLAAL